MRIERLRFDEVPDARYRALVGNSFFASRGFAELWRERSGEPCVWCAGVDGTIAGVLPGVEFRRGPWVRFASMPDGCYGGVFVAPEAGGIREPIARAILETLTRRYAIVDVFDFRRSVLNAPGYTERACEARLITLTGGAWVPTDSALVQQAKKAERKGIRIEPFDAARHLSGLMHLAHETARVHRSRQRYPRAFFAGLATLAQRDPRILWRWCEHEGRPAASHIYVIEGGMLMAWQSYFDRAFSFLKPNPAIRLEVARSFARDGGRILNLGATPAFAVGLRAYKQRWGGSIVTYPDHTWSIATGVRERVAALLGSPRNGSPVPAHAMRRAREALVQH